MARRLRAGSDTLLRAAVMFSWCLTSGSSLQFGVHISAVSRTSPARVLGSRGVVKSSWPAGGRARSAHPGKFMRMSTEVGQQPSVASEGKGTSHESLVGKESSLKPPVKKRVVSGVQPTGNLHLGNYLGSIKQWVDNQDKFENFFFVVDLHAITVPQDPKQLKLGVFNAAATYLAAGVDPEKSKVFVQSHVSAHSELTWLLTCCTPLNWLERMIQFKEKKVKQGENVGAGLMTYPVLMAADILLYRPDLVPTGEDQRQHLELTRDLARRFNDQFCKRKRRTFKEPEALIGKEAGRIMSLTDGSSKMSKSDPVEGSRINLTDPPDVINRKLRKCKTDMFTGLEWDNPDRPECTNLLTIYQSVTDKTRDEIALEVQDMSWGTFKPLLAEATVEYLKPFQARYKDIIEDRTFLNQVLRDGAEAADEVATETLGWAKEAMGIPSLKDLYY
ncbi:unnamed protein product [Ascophyllum nodosum]